MKSSRVVRAKTAKRKPATSRRTNHSVKQLLLDELPHIALVALVVIVFLAFANTLGNDFVFDDIYLVAQNSRIRTLDLGLLVSSYRPLRDFSYAIDFAIWGEGPFGFHLTNIVLHAGNTLLVFALIRRFTGNILTAFLTSLIFAIHPIQTDSVSYISGRRDLLFSFFYLLAFHSYLTYHASSSRVKSIGWFCLFLLCWALGLLSKEMAASLPAVIFVWHYCEAWPAAGPLWKQIISTTRRTIAKDKWFWIFLSALVVAFTTYWVLFSGGSRRAINLEYWGGSFFTNFITVARVHVWYLKQLVYPTPIAQYLGVFEPSQSLFEWSVLLSLAVVGAIMVFGFWLLNRERKMAFAIFSYFALLLPVSHIIPHHELLADHYLYLPMMSFGLFVALVATKIAGRGETEKKVVYAASAAVVILLAGMTLMQNRTWKNERTLWTANYKAVPGSPRAALNLGNTYQDTEPQKAEELFKRALELNPPPQIKRTLYDRLTVLLIQQQKLDEAEFFARQVLEQSPHDFFGNLWSSQIYTLKKDCDKARQALTRAESAGSKPRELSLAAEARQQFAQQCGP